MEILYDADIHKEGETMKSVILLLLCMCLGSNALAQAPAVPRNTEETAIRDADESWAKAVSAKLIEPTVAMYDPEVLTAGSAMPPVNGLAEIRAMWTKYFSDPDFTMKWKPENVLVTESGNIGYSFGKWDGGSEGGPYLAVWRKNGGTWKVLIDAAWLSGNIGSADAKPPATPTGPATFIRKADEACLMALTKRALEREVACYQADAVMTDNAMVQARGSAELRAMFSKYFSDPSFSLTWKLENVAVAKSGAVGYSAGTWRYGRESGPYLAVWKKQSDGKWKMLIDSTWTFPLRK